MKCYKDYVIEVHEHHITKKVLIEIAQAMSKAQEIMHNTIITGGELSRIRAEQDRNLCIVTSTIKHFNDKFKHCGKFYDYSEEGER